MNQLRVNALPVQDPATGRGNFFIGNSAGDIFCLEFDRMEHLRFPESLKNLEKEKFLTIHGSLFEKMIPLSDYRKGVGKTELFYKEYCGCLALSGNNAICIYFKREKGKGHLHTSTKVFPDLLIDIKCLPFEGFCWAVASDRKKKLHFIKNVTDTDPWGENLELIFDGEYISIELQDRIFNLCTIPVLPGMENHRLPKYQGYLGMGNHTVVPINIHDYEGKLKEAHELFCRIVDENNQIAQLEKVDNKHILLIIEGILDYFRNRYSRTAVKMLLLDLMTRMTPVFCKLILSHAFSRVFFKTIENEKNDLIQKTIKFLSQLDKPLPGFQTAINEFHTHIKKFISDGPSYSEKSENLKELLEYNEKTGNLIDSIVYRGILYDRQYDPVAHFSFDKEKDGEITRIVPFIPFKKETFFISTSKGKLFRMDFQSMEKKLVLEYKKPMESPTTVLKINNLYLGKERVFLFLTDPVIVVKKISELEFTSTAIEVNAQDQCCIRLESEKSCGTSICRMPWDESKGDECFVGTNQGDIFYINPFDHSISKVAQGSPDQAAISDLLTPTTLN